MGDAGEEALPPSFTRRNIDLHLPVVDPTRESWAWFRPTSLPHL